MRAACCLVLAFLCLPVIAQTQAVQTPAINGAADNPLPDPDINLGQKLRAVRRIFVEPFGDDVASKQVHAMLIASLSGATRFIVTENRERADAVLKGAGLEKSSQEIHSYSDKTAAGGFAASATRHYAGAGGSAAAISDSSTSTETLHDARVAVRLVDKDGDVIWSTTQESKGAKYKGASADVADKVVKQLLRDIAKLDAKPKPE